MKLIILSSALTVLFLSACKPAERITDATEPPGKLEQLSSAIDQIFTRSDIFSQSFTGFSLYDPENDLELYSFNGGRNFIPASNTKLFTFYAGLLTLPERVPALAYIEREDSLIFWGTGDPSFLHHDFGSDSVYQFLKSHESSLYFSDSNFKDNHLGSGWAWDDYNYYYSAEKSPLPVYGNVARFGIDEIRTTRLSRNNGEVIVSPSYFKNHIKEEEDNEFTLPIIMRERTGNQFQSFIRRDTSSYYRDVPFHYNPKLITEILSDTLGREIHYTDSVLPADYEVLHSIPADTLFRRMLLPSDNFIAEQILLNISMSLFGEMNTDKVIQLISDKYLKELPDRPRWVDGSGLSRYNLFTPRSIVQLLIMIDREVDDDGRLFSLLPAGGVTGTLQNSYRHPDGTGPWVFAKTGTLSNNHSLSGFIITKSGKKLIFSFMNNNYMVPASSIRSEMERILWTVHNAM